MASYFKLNVQLIGLKGAAADRVVAITSTRASLGLCDVLLQGFEMIKSLYLDPEQFTVENGLMTPTFKLKRPPLQSKYTPQIEAMYKKINSGN